MNVIIHPGKLQGIVQAPASKSSMQRACAASLLHEGTSLIHQPGHSNDDLAALDIIQRLGALVEKEQDSLRISSEGIRPNAAEVNCGESGLSIRMFTPICALSDQPLTINGSGSLLVRPMDFFDEILPRLGVSINSRQGRLPLQIQGPLQARDLEVDGSLSSQFLTGLLMAFSAAFMRRGELSQSVTLRVNNLKSKPYIDLTLDVMQRFGMWMPENNRYESFIFHAGKQTPAPDRVSYTVEGDWSGGAFLLVAGAIAGPITVRGLDLGSTQADRAVMDALMQAGAAIAMDGKQIDLQPVSLTAFEFDATDCPDLFPPLVALASACEGESRIIGVSRLAHKESNRGLTLQEEFAKLGVKVELDGDLMRINGAKELDEAVLHSRHDHRIAMACAVAALRAKGPVQIEEAEAVNKSYPDFYDHLRQLQAKLEISRITIPHIKD